MDRQSRQLEMPIPNELIDAIAERVADIILDRLGSGARIPDQLADGPRGSGPGTWMRSAEVAQYLGWSRKSVYRRVARMEMPHYKIDGILLFKRDELDAWLEQFREEPRAQETLPVPLNAGRRPPRARAVARQRATAEIRKDGPAKEPKTRAPRPLPPPLGGDEQDRDKWANELEITREELDEMSPRDFVKAWDERNERLRDGGVFQYVTELTDAHGWNAIEEMTTSEMIRAVADLGLTPSTANPKLGNEREPAAGD